jgi:hypothetical protein
LSGSVVNLDSISIKGLEYNNEVDMTDDVNDMLLELNSKMDEINNNVTIQWKN